MLKMLKQFFGNLLFFLRKSLNEFVEIEADEGVNVRGGEERGRQLATGDQPAPPLRTPR
jgi:hypothetical protein